jgi:hypothetical protein
MSAINRVSLTGKILSIAFDFSTGKEVVRIQLAFPQMLDNDGIVTVESDRQTVLNFAHRLKPSCCICIAGEMRYSEGQLHLFCYQMMAAKPYFQGAPNVQKQFAVSE